MFDRQTDSLWNQFTGEPVSGPMAKSGIKLKIRPVAIASWSDWKAAHPGSKVLSLDTGHRRNYGSGVVYKEYFASPDLIFPSADRSTHPIKRKDYVFGIRGVGAAKAWPLEAFETRQVINDAVGNRKIVLIGNSKTRTVRAYERGGRKFHDGTELRTISGPGGDWHITEAALTGPDGTKLSRIPGPRQLLVCLGQLSRHKKRALSGRSRQTKVPPPCKQHCPAQPECSLMKPRITVLLGDRNGIGPELVAKLLSDDAVTDAASITVLGDPACFG